MARPQFFDVRQFFEISQTEVIEKELGRFVKQRAPRNFGAAGNFDEPAFHQCLQNAIDGDAADGLDVGARDRLSISNDGKRLERGRTQARRFWCREKSADPLRVFWIACQLPAVSFLDMLKPV